MHRKNNSKGFTLIELLISLAILMLVFVLAIFGLRTFGSQVEIDNVGQDITSALKLARSRTLASEAASNYGVHFETGKYVIFTGTTYTPGASSNKEFSLSSSEIYTINLNGGGSEVVFDRIRGTTSEYGNVSVRLTSDNNQTRTININSSGQSSLNDTLTTSNTRVIDSRHLHFDLGWNIQNSTTLTLNFPNDSYSQNIAMAGFFNAGKTSFDWSATVTVAGVDQVLRIQTHCLNDSSNCPTDTFLSIERDVRYNTKALTVSIDGKQIVSYNAAGIATVGSFGGVMTTQ
ncbi:MAG TPA: prepilin-type N-terminal cleavage/methylation domain-containing protein [Candidatus Saccharimonadales bacterium]|nr:prepilin-type N-terminal cleavage/methylation domain-containing protein [Candidatus Saccharimonadales bacterium]